MTHNDIGELLRRAVETSDPAVMRQAFDRLIARGPNGPDAPSPEAEHETRHPDYVMEMPQSGKRIRGREAMRSVQENLPSPPAITVRRVVGAHRMWVLEGVNDFDGDVWHAVVILELDRDGRILRDTRYYAKPFVPPGWRAE